MLSFIKISIYIFIKQYSLLSYLLYIYINTYAHTHKKKISFSYGTDIKHTKSLTNKKKTAVIACKSINQSYCPLLIAMYLAFLEVRHISNAISSTVKGSNEEDTFISEN